MALVVESFASATSTAGTITLTKPTGLAVGNLMVVMLSFARNSVTNPEIQIAAGWTGVTAHGTFTSAAIQYRIADAADVAASNFTFVSINQVLVITAGRILRISGHEPANISLGSINLFTDSAAIDTAVTFSGSITTPVPDCLLVMAIACSDGIAATVSAQQTTPASTLTEAYDHNGSTAIALSGAYGFHNAVTTITQFGATLSANLDNHAGVLLLIRAAFPFSGTNALLSVSPELFPQAGVGGTTGTNALLTATPELFNQNGLVLTPTVWTPKTKTPATWTPETK